MNKILITGGKGAIGSNIAMYLNNLGHKITIVDNLTTPNRNKLDKNILFFKADINNTNFLENFFKNRKFDYLIHAAAFFANQNSVDNPEKDLQVNGLGTINLLKYLNKINKKFIYLSSSCVYEYDFIEDKNFSNSKSTPYAISKKIGEDYVEYFCKRANKKYLNLRLFNNYGPGELPGKYRNVIPNFIYNAIKNKDLVITGSGDETRDFNFVEDTIKYIIKLSFSNKIYNQVFNIGSGKSYKIADIAEKIIKLSKSKSKIKYIKKREWDNISKRKANVNKLKKNNVYIKPTKIDEGLSITIKWMKEIFR